MLFPESDRIRFSKNPLQEVICQIRFPLDLQIQSEPPRKFQQQIRSRFPDLTQQRTVDLNLSALSGLTNSTNMASAVMVYTFDTDDGLWRGTLAPESLALSTTAYTRWEEFREYLDLLVSALISVYEVPRITRVGLRYRDLISRDELGIQEMQWQELLQPFMLGFISSPVGHYLQLQNCVEVLQPDDTDINVRIQHGLAQRPNSPERVYIIDTDFYTEKRRSIDELGPILNRFNHEAGNFFRSCITEKLRAALE